LRSRLVGRESQRSIMGATRTIWRAVAAVAGLAVVVACRSGGNQRGRPTTSQPPKAFASAAMGAASAEAAARGLVRAPLPSAVVQTLRAVREQRLEIAAPTTQSTLLAFGTGRLLQASIDKATFRDSRRGEVITEASIGAVRAVAHGVDGSLFAIGASDCARLEPRAKLAKHSPHVTFLPGSLLWADLEEPSHFFVYYPEDEQLFWYPFESEAGAFLPIDATFHLEGCQEPLVQLRDGAIVCRTATGYVRKAPRGSRSIFSLPPGADPPIRLLPGQRLDEFFAISRAGEVLHLRLTPGLPVLARFRLPAPAYAAVANTDALAFVLVKSPESGQPRRWTLLVTDFAGLPRLQIELPGDSPGADEDWLAAVVEDKNLAISGFEPLVAVGGASRVAVWDYSQAEQLFAR